MRCRIRSPSGIKIRGQTLLKKEALDCSNICFSSSIDKRKFGRDAEIIKRETYQIWNRVGSKQGIYKSAFIVIDFRNHR